MDEEQQQLHEPLKMIAHEGCRERIGACVRCVCACVCCLCVKLCPDPDSAPEREELCQQKSTQQQQQSDDACLCGKS